MCNRTAPAQTEILIRPSRDVAEMHIGVDLQRQVWGYSETDIVPEQMFIVAQESGGQVLFAFEREQAIGFALAFAGIHGNKSYLHSHMVGVAPRHQNQGVGRLLKLAQRSDALARGIDLIEWTFDPLQLKNAHLNLARLGAIVRRYIANFYGRTSSPLHAGLPTDRLVAEWWIQSPRVQALINGGGHEPTPHGVRISLPSTIREICASDPVEAEKIQARIRAEFAKYLAKAYAAVGFELDEQQGSYVLGPYED
jgi:predicted GNAT superfamily acetyltransferase